MTPRKETPSSNEKSQGTPATDAAATTLDDYELSASLLSRWSGTVYAGRFRKTGLVVAIEKLDEDLCDNEDFSHELSKVGGRLAKIRNSHLVSTFDMRTTDDGMYLITELPQGKLLADLAASEPLSASDLLAVADDLLRGLSVLHSHNLSHGDVREESLVVLADGTIKLADCALSRAASLTSPPDFSLGTPDPDPDAPPAARDVYAAAAVLSNLIPKEDPADPVHLPRQISTILASACAPSHTQRPSSSTILHASLMSATVRSMGHNWRSLSTLGERVATHAVTPAGESREKPKRPSQPAEPTLTSTATKLPPHVEDDDEDIEAPGAATEEGLQPGASAPSRATRAQASAEASAAPSPTPQERKGGMRWLGWVVMVILVIAAGASGTVAGFAVEGKFPPPPAHLPLTLVGGITLTAAPPEGSCNTNFLITATGVLHGAGTLTYQWKEVGGPTIAPVSVSVSRSDGSFRLVDAWRVNGEPSTLPAVTFTLLSPSGHSQSTTLHYSCQSTSPSGSTTPSSTAPA